MEKSPENPKTKTETVNSSTNKVSGNSLPVKDSRLTTKNAVEFLISGTLQSKVCKSCLNVTPLLTSLTEILEVACDGALYKISVQDMIASFNPHVMTKDTDLPNKICKKCLNHTINSYLFNQQYKQSKQALLSCFNDINANMDLLDPLVRPKLGRKKLHTNCNVINTTHKYVKEYAQPLIQLVKAGSLIDANTNPLPKHECPKCWEVLPSQAILMIHEKKHPKDMWFRCRFCGLSFARKMSYKRHIKKHESQSDPKSDVASKPVDEKFICETCDTVSENHIYHLQHMEKHKFKKVVENVLTKKADDLCTVCLDSSKDMVSVDKTVALHGGFQEVMGDVSVSTILAATLPDINPKSFFGNKICESCLDAAISAYIFTNKSNYTRRRLDQCLTRVLDKLKEVKAEGNIVIEISKELIMPVKETDLLKNAISAFIEDLDESKLHQEVLEDKYRNDSESDENRKENRTLKSKKSKKSITKINGIATIKNMDVSEFLTFKTKSVRKKISKFTCPMCCKHFVSDYFLKKHALKHANRKANCEICKKQFESRFSLKEHTKMAHKLQKSYVSCEKCTRTFDSELQLLKHKQSHIRIQCQLCDKYFKSQRFYDSHLQRHSTKLRLRQKASQSCSFCEKLYTNRNDLNVHVNKAHLRVRQFICDMCKCIFYTQKNLNSHKKLHRVYSFERCQFCDKTLTSRKSLVIHVRKHMNCKPVKCLACDESFYSEAVRNRHMLKTHGGRFVCKLCKSAFAGRSQLKTHVGKDHALLC